MFPHLARSTFACVALTCVALTCVASAATAQQRPSPQEAEALLKSNPELAAQIRSRLRDSGLTPEQVRARLRAEGYPESLLDSYLQPTGAAGTDSVPSATVIAAVRALSVAPDSLDLGLERNPTPPEPERPPRPGITCDTVAVAPAQPRADSVTLDARRTGARATQVNCKSSDGRTVAPPDSGRTIFGLDLFSSPTSQFDPNLAGPVDGSYKLGAGDQLVLLLTGEV